MNLLTRLALGRPLSCLVLAAVVTAVMAVFAFQLRKDNDVSTMVPEDDPDRRATQEIADRFEAESIIVLGLFPRRSIFDLEVLGIIREVTVALEAMTLLGPQGEEELQALAGRLEADLGQALRHALEGGLKRQEEGVLDEIQRRSRGLSPDDKILLANARIRLRPLSEVVSIANVEDIRGTLTGIEVGPLMPDPLPQGAAMEAWRERVRAHRLVSGRLIGADGRAAAILARPTFKVEDVEIASEASRAIHALARRHGHGVEIHISGMPVVLSVVGDYMDRDMGRQLPLVIGVIVVVLLLSFWSLRGIVLPLMVVSGAIAWTLGLMTLIDIPLTILGTAIPVLLMAIGCADGIHIINEYGVLAGTLGERRAVVEATMGRLSWPVVMTSLTTMVGFLSLTTNPIPQIQHFGIFISVGVLVAMVLSLTIVPAMLMLMPLPRRALRSPGKGHGIGPIGALLYRRAPLVLALVGVVVIASAYGASQLRVNHSTIEEFNEDDPIRLADNLLNRHFGGTLILDLMLDGGRPGAAKEPGLLLAMGELEARIRELEGVGCTLSLVPYLEKVNREINEGDPAFERLPREVEVIPGEEGEEAQTVAGRDQVAQLILLYESGGGAGLAQLVDHDRQRLHVTVQLKVHSSNDVERIAEAIRGDAARIIGDRAQVTFGGIAYLSMVISKLIVRGQVLSLMTSVAMVLLMMVLLLRSFKDGLMAVFPLLVTILATFGMMTAAGVDLNVGTALIAGMGVGIGVDYAIHFMARLREAEGRDRRGEEVAYDVFSTTGKAIVSNALAVGLGMMALVPSSFIPVSQIGWLGALNMLVSGFGSLVILTALARYRRRRGAAVEEVRRVGGG